MQTIFVTSKKPGVQQCICKKRADCCYMNINNIAALVPADD